MIKHIVDLNGKAEDSALTSTEALQRSAEIEKAQDAEPMRQWLASIAATDAKMPRALEDVIDAMGADMLPVYTKSIYDSKKEIRAKKPV